MPLRRYYRIVPGEGHDRYLRTSSDVERHGGCRWCNAVGFNDRSVARSGFEFHEVVDADGDDEVTVARLEHRRMYDLHERCWAADG